MCKIANSFWINTWNDLCHLVNNFWHNSMVYDLQHAGYIL